MLAIVRPFKIGNTITIFGITGSVRDIGLLLYVWLSTIQDKKTVLAPNGTMLGAAIVKERKIAKTSIRRGMWIQNLTKFATKTDKAMSFSSIR